MYKSQLILSYFKDKNVSLTSTIEYSEKDIINGVVSKSARELVKMADYLDKVREDKQQLLDEIYKHITDVDMLIYLLSMTKSAYNEEPAFSLQDIAQIACKYKWHNYGITPEQARKLVSFNKSFKEAKVKL